MTTKLSAEQLRAKSEAELDAMALDQPEMRDAITQELFRRRYHDTIIAEALAREQARREEEEADREMIRADAELVAMAEARVQPILAAMKRFDDHLHALIAGFHQLKELCATHGGDSGIDQFNSVLRVYVADAIRSCAIDLPPGTMYAGADKPTIWSRLGHWPESQVNDLKRGISKAQRRIADGRK